MSSHYRADECLIVYLTLKTLEEILSWKIDRRGNSRSVWSAPHNVDVAQQRRDAAAFLEATKTKIADMYGNSSGSIIALELATVFPEMVNTVVIHEPPLVKVLPDKDKWLAFFANIHSTTTRLGSEIANTKFTFPVGVSLSAFSYILAARKNRYFIIRHAIIKGFRYINHRYIYFCAV